MANMSYCRFENTLQDLRDCDDHLSDDLSSDEHLARKKLIELCKSIVEQSYDEDGEPDGYWNEEKNDDGDRCDNCNNPLDDDGYCGYCENCINNEE